MQWVDDDFVTVNDLLSLDPEITEISETEGIVLAGSSGMIRRAKEDCQAFISRFMSFSGLSPSDLTLRNMNMPVGTVDLRYNYAGFAQLTVSGDDWDNWSSLKRYVVAVTLRKFYRAASNKKADRYSDRYDDMAIQVREDFWPNLRRRGLPIIWNPLEAPGAIMNRCGRFGTSNVALVAGSGSTAESYDFAITWVGSRYVSPSSKDNGESYRSARVSLSGDGAQVFQVNKIGLTAPNGMQPEHTKSSCRYSPGVAVGWNVWACKTPDPSTALGVDFDHPVMYRQNTSVIPLTNDTFALPSDPILSGETLDLGQIEDVVLELRSELQRG